MVNNNSDNFKILIESDMSVKMNCGCITILTLSKLLLLFLYRKEEKWENVMQLPSDKMKDASIRLFESRMENLNHSFCVCCHKVSLNMKVNKKNVCTVCVPFKDTDYYLKRNSLPVWYDDNGIVQYHVPECLKDLSIAEKMLIQLASPFVPLKHIKNGTMGLTGHVCAFQQDIEGFVNTLPRSIQETTMISLIKVVMNEFGSDERREEYFQVRKKNVGNALMWLKKYNVLFKDINIDMTRLNWMIGDEDTIEHVTIFTSKGVNTEEETGLNINEDLGPCPAYTQKNIATSSRVKEIGTLDESTFGNMNEEDEKILGEIKMSIDKSENKMDISVCFPKRDTSPINEYSSLKVFAMAYPWLFPGGVGDVKDFPGKPKEWGKFIHQYQDGRFGSDSFFAFFATNYIVRNRNSSSSNWFLRNFNNKGPKNLDELKKSIEQKNTKFVNQLTYYCQSIKGSSPYWFHKKHELYSWVNHHVEAGHGPPSFFITLSCAEYQWPDMIRLLKQRIELAGGNSNDCYVGSPKLSTILNQYSIVVQELFQNRVKHWLDTVGKVVFDIKHHWIRYEFAPGRGQIHAHLLAITGDMTIMELCHNDLKEENGKMKRDARLAEWAEKRFGLTATVEDGFESRMPPGKVSPCTLRYHEVDNKGEDAQDLLKACQVHQCSGFCLRSKDKKRFVSNMNFDNIRNIIPDNVTIVIVYAY